MPGHVSVVHARLKEPSPHSLYVHCCNHSVELTLQEIAHEVSLIAGGPTFVQGVALLIKECKKLFESLFCFEDVIVNILSLCPTWNAQTKSLQGQQSLDFISRHSKEKLSSVSMLRTTILEVVTTLQSKCALVATECVNLLME